MYTIHTPKGTIHVKENVDPNYPGVWIEIDGEVIAVIDYDSEQDHLALRVWDHKKPDDDYIYKQTISPKEEEE